MVTTIDRTFSRAAAPLRDSALSRSNSSSFSRSRFLTTATVYVNARTWALSAATVSASEVISDTTASASRARFLARVSATVYFRGILGLVVVAPRGEVRFVVDGFVWSSAARDKRLERCQTRSCPWRGPSALSRSRLERVSPSSTAASSRTWRRKRDALLLERARRCARSLRAASSRPRGAPRARSPRQRGRPRVPPPPRPAFRARPSAASRSPLSTRQRRRGWAHSRRRRRDHSRRPRCIPCAPPVRPTPSRGGRRERPPPGRRR